MLTLTANAQDANKPAREVFTVALEEYPGALRNPLKGFRPLTEDALYGEKRYATITHSYFKWNELEDHENDTVERIKDLCNLRWAGVEAKGIKVIPSIYLDFNEEEKYWPSDMTTGDYSSTQFKRRLARLIHRLGECWDNDPRVAWIETSIIGLWGEQHSPSPTPEIQKIMGDAFTRAFKNKKFLVRHPNEFTEYEVGYCWGSWAHGVQLNDDAHGAGIKRVNRQTGRWKTHPIEGETAYNWGTADETLGGSPNKTLTTPKHLETLLDSIRDLHCTGLGWVAKYRQDDPAARAGAEKVQRAFGYRFVIKHFRSVRRAEPGGTLPIKFSVVNTGSAPFYADWPVELSLLDPTDHSLVWRARLKGVDVRDWLSGDDWNASKNAYRTPPKTHVVTTAVRLPENLRPGKHLIALAILDPAGHEPAVRFAVKNYLPGGRHPMGWIGIGVDLRGIHKPPLSVFVDPMAEDRLGYAPTSPHKSTGRVTIPAWFDDECDPDNKWVVGTNRTTLNALNHNSWAVYKDYNFGTATNHIRITASSASQGGQIQLRVGGPMGRKIGSVEITPTGGWRDFKRFEASLDKPMSGVHDLCLVFIDSRRASEYLFDIESFRLDRREPRSEP